MSTSNLCFLQTDWSSRAERTIYLLPHYRKMPRFFASLRLTRLLLALELRLPFFQERRGSFFLVLSRAAHAEQSRLQIEPFGQGHLHALIDGLHGILHRERRIRDDFLSDSFGARD